MLCCDLIVAAAGATFADAHARRGIALALGGAAGLVRAAGELRAKQILLLSESWDAATMAAFGLVADVGAGRTGCRPGRGPWPARSASGARRASRC